MEIAEILQLVKDYGIANVLIVSVLLYLLKGKIDQITKSISHVDNAVNNREVNAPTMSQEVSLIRQELGLFKKESLTIMKDLKLLRKEGYLAVKQLKIDIDYIKKEIDAHRSVDEKAFLEIKEDLKNFK